MGSELNCTPGKRGTGGETRMGESWFNIFFFVNFSAALHYLNAWNRLRTSVNGDKTMYGELWLETIKKISHAFSLSIHLQLTQFHSKVKGLKAKKAS